MPQRNNRDQDLDEGKSELGQVSQRERDLWGLEEHSESRGQAKDKKK